MVFKKGERDNRRKGVRDAGNFKPFGFAICASGVLSL